jgi:lactoylglutathione lyase
MKLSFVTIYVADIEKSIDFYQRVLGMTVSRRFSPRPGMEIAFMGDGAQVELIHDPQAKPFQGRGISLGFNVANIDGTLALLKENRVEIVHGPVSMPNGVKLLHARDLNGVDLGFVQQ